MSKLSAENIEFLKTLSSEMKNQDPLGTASPRLWVIRDVKEVPTSDDYADGYQPFDEDNCEELDSEDLDERIALAVDEEGDDKLNNFIKGHHYLELDYAELADWNLGLKVELLFLYGENIKLIPYIEEIFVTDTAGSFLTQQAAKNHIEANRHHYSNNVHTYCIHAWRNPEMERLIDIIEQTKWDA